VYAKCRPRLKRYTEVKEAVSQLMINSEITQFRRYTTLFEEAFGGTEL